MIGGSLPAALAANVLAAAWDQNAGLVASSPVAAKLEDGGPELVGGCVGAAGRDQAVVLSAGRPWQISAGWPPPGTPSWHRLGWDVEAQGLFGAPPVTVVVGEEVHVSLLKALSLLGLGRERVVRVPVDNQGRMKAQAMPRLSGPAIVCIQAGNVNTGAFDPAAEICRIAHDAGAWVHVDGAFGLWAAAVPARAHLAAGVSEADSWATDAHKWLNVPYDSGLVFCRAGRRPAGCPDPQPGRLPGRRRPARADGIYPGDVAPGARN